VHRARPRVHRHEREHGPAVKVKTARRAREFGCDGEERRAMVLEKPRSQGDMSRSEKNRSICAWCVPVALTANASRRA
jgi:hypothetical protein